MTVQKMVKVEACTVCRCNVGEQARHWGYVFTATEVGEADEDGVMSVKLIGEITADDLKGFVKAGRVNKL